jgi:hypothetical protein
MRRRRSVWDQDAAERFVACSDRFPLPPSRRSAVVREEKLAYLPSRAMSNKPTFLVSEWWAGLYDAQ